MSGERIVKANGVHLCVETFGDGADPAILLVHGASASMLWWEQDLCERIAAGRRYVIRFDNRDTGRSVSYPPGRPGYSIRDMAEDAVGILDVLGVERAHLVGRSMAGGIVTLAAAYHHDRVASLTLVSTTGGGPDLPPMSKEFTDYVGSGGPDPSDPAAVVEFIVGLMRAYAGGSPYFDEAAMRALAEQDATRTSSLASCLTNHFVIDTNDPGGPGHRQIDAPVLVVHGELDPVFPPAHGRALQQSFPGAELLILEQTGHELPPPTWDVVVPAILRHTSGGWEEEEERLASKSLAAGDPTGWFDQLYSAAAAGETDMPWDRREPHPLLHQWAQSRRLAGAGRRAVVVGCGLGADAEYTAGLGYDTVGFDVSGTAVRLATVRFPGSTVRYVAADLLDPPQDWLRAFDLVVEVITVQALPDPPRRQAITNVGRLVGHGGTLIVIAAVQDDNTPPAQGPPWPLSRAEIGAFATDGLNLVRIENVAAPGRLGERRWRAEFHRGTKG